MSAVDPLKLIVLLAALGLAPPAAAADGERAELPSLGMAADAPPAAADPEGAAGTADTAPAEEDGGDASADAEPSGDVFVPTEEISEDYAVSFPVDI